MMPLLTFLVAWSLKAAVAIAFGSVVALVVRHRSGSIRNLVWRMTFIAAILMPLGMVAGPRFGLPVGPTHAAATQSAPPSTIASTNPAVLQVNKIAPEPAWGPGPWPGKPAGIAQQQAEAPNPLAALLGGVYLAGVSFFALRWVIGFRRISAIARWGQPGLVRDENLRYRVIFAQGRDLTVPVTFGVRSPTILLPNGAEGWPSERLGVAVLHEAAHIERKDWAWQSIAAFATAIHWLNPAFWVLHLALEKSAETAADDAVLNQGVAPSRYAGELLHLAQAAHPVLSVGTAMARSGGVADRLKRILAPNPDRRRAGPTTVTALATFFVVLGLGISGLTTADAVAFQTESKTAHQHSVSSAKLPGNVLARITFLTGANFPGHACWRPDGSKATEADTKQAKGSTLSNSGNSNVDRIVNLFFDITGLRVDDGVGVDVKVDAGANVTPLGVSQGSLNPPTTLKAPLPKSFPISEVQASAGFIFPTVQHPVDIRLGIADSPFKVAVKCKSGEAPLHAVLKTLASDNESSAGQNTLRQVQVTIDVPPELAKKDLKFSALDASGRPVSEFPVLQMPAYNLPGREAPDKRTYVVVVQSGDIAQLQLEAREYKWVTFRSIHLRPNSTKSH
jgi:beta-lactamase regulating signal transducer with metallopeptidase domain